MSDFLESRAALAGKVAIVTGGGGGLGRAVTLDFARAGMQVAFYDRDEAATGETRRDAEAAAAGGGVLADVLDARDSESVASFFDRVDAAFGSVEVLVNVVGGTFHASFVESNAKGWDALIRANFVQVLDNTQGAVTRMRAAGRGGSVINLTSIEAHRAAPGYAVYAAMKAALTSLTRTLAVELAPDGIRVNAIAPDIVPTPGMLETNPGFIGTPKQATMDAVNDRIGIPMGRKGTYEDIGNCALFLASDLSSYITGTTLHPDGGALASSGWFHWPEGYSNFVPDSVLDRIVKDLPED